jgi:hypothetical protein
MMSGSNGSMKVFRASEPSGAPIQFGIEVVRNGRRETHKFRAVPGLPMGALRFIMGLDESAGEGEEFTFKLTSVAAGVKLVFDTFRLFLPAAEFERFEALANDPEVAMELELLAEIIGWLIEQYTGRPTVPSSSSGDGRQPSSESSTATSSPAASTSSSSPPSGT